MISIRVWSFGYASILAFGLFSVLLLAQHPTDAALLEPEPKLPDRFQVGNVYMLDIFYLVGRWEPWEEWSTTPLHS